MERVGRALTHLMTNAWLLLVRSIASYALYLQ